MGHPLSAPIGPIVARNDQVKRPADQPSRDLGHPVCWPPASRRSTTTFPRAPPSRR